MKSAVTTERTARRKALMKRWLLVSALASSVLQLRASDTKSGLGVSRPLEVGEIRDEVDPSDEQRCYSMGLISLTYQGGVVGPPNVGLRITDPKGREIGYDPRSRKAWQQLPFAEGSFDCDENEDTLELRSCTGHFEICGPISGTYKVEVLPAQGGKYLISVSGTSQVIRDDLGLHSTDSRAELKGKIKEKQGPEILLLKYSREAGAQIKLTRSR